MKRFLNPYFSFRNRTNRVQYLVAILTLMSALVLIIVFSQKYQIKSTDQQFDAWLADFPNRIADLYESQNFADQLFVQRSLPILSK
ncbi:MAG: hypothetical protein WBE18_01780 [Gammaproteobacteria bacterium]